MLGNRVQNYSKEDLKEVQSALNFFGFKAGCDGVAKRAIANTMYALILGNTLTLLKSGKTYQKYNFLV